MFKIDLNRLAAVVMCAFVFFLGANLYAQNNAMSKTKQNDVYKEIAQKWTTQLNQKVNLTQDQQTKIQGILVDYQSAKANTDMNNSQKLQQTYDQKIQSVLNDSQKKAYMDYSSQWWKMISKRTSKKPMDKKY